MSDFEDFEEGKVPFCLTHEQTVIYASCESEDAWYLINSVLTEDDFYSPHHRKMFGLIKKLRDKKIKFDFPFFCQFLAQNNFIEDVGGEQYLEFLVRNSIITANLSVYINLVRDYAIERKLLQAVNHTKNKILNKDGTSTTDILAELENNIMVISHQKSAEDGLEAFGSNDLLIEFAEKLKEAIERGDSLSGVDTGLIELNKYTDGLQKCDLIYLGARPSMGKTTLGMNFVESALFAQELPVVVFSMESPKHQIVQRLVSSVSGVPLNKIIKIDYNEYESSKISMAISKIKNRKLIICDKGGLSPSDMRTVLRKVVREHGGVGLIMADYVQKMELKGFSKKNNRNEELSIVSADLKEIAKQFNCPFVCLAQLSKDCEKRPNKRPMMSDLRDCGGLEQDADMVIMLYRNSVYFPKDEESKGLAELIITKNRNGQTGTIITRFNAPIFRFENMPSEDDAF